MSSLINPTMVKEPIEDDPRRIIPHVQIGDLPIRLLFGTSEPQQKSRNRLDLAFESLPIVEMA
jgi:hypothetical protein